MHARLLVKPLSYTRQYRFTVPRCAYRELLPRIRHVYTVPHHTPAPRRYREFDTDEGMFVTHDFGWEDHAYTMLQRFYPAAGEVLDKEFSVAFGLTYQNFGPEKVRGECVVWSCVHCVHRTC